MQSKLKMKTIDGDGVCPIVIDASMRYYVRTILILADNEGKPIQCVQHSNQNVTGSPKNFSRITFLISIKNLTKSWMPMDVSFSCVAWEMVQMWNLFMRTLFDAVSLTPAAL